MKKIYETPAIDLLKFDTIDILTASNTAPTLEESGKGDSIGLDDLLGLKA